MVLLPANADSEIIYGESMASMEDKEDIDPCIMWQMKKLGGWFNPAAEQYISRGNRN